MWRHYNGDSGEQYGGGGGGLEEYEVGYWDVVGLVRGGVDKYFVGARPQPRGLS